MQLLVRCGAPLGSVCLHSAAEEDGQDMTVLQLKQRLSQRAPSVLGPPTNMILLWSGRQLHDSDLLSHALPPSPSFTTLHLTHRLLGGGGDGGSTGAESRSCYLEMYAGKRIDKVNPAEELLAKWTRCHLSGEPLSPPVVADELGNLFNKDAVVGALLNKAIPPPLAYISGLKNLIDLKLQRRGDAETKHMSAAAAANDALYCCPVSGVALNGKYKSVVFRASGHVVSEKALKDAPAVVEELVGGRWGPDDLLPINPSGEVLDVLKERLLARLAQEREKKRNKKSAKGGAAAAAAGEAAAAAAAAAAEGGHDTAAPPDSASDPAAAAAAAAAAEAAPKSKRSAAAAAAAEVEAGVQLPAGSKPPAAKRAKALALDSMPKHSDKKIYSSLFSSSVLHPEKETYCCRSTSARGVHLS